MKIYAKLALMAGGVAVLSSALTAVALDRLRGAGNTDKALFTAMSEDGSASSRGFLTVSNSVTPPTDFTHAAESTINGVVSIKSYASPRGYQGGDGGFSNPL